MRPLRLTANLLALALAGFTVSLAAQEEDLAKELPRIPPRLRRQRRSSHSRCTTGSTSKQWPLSPWSSIP